MHVPSILARQPSRIPGGELTERPAKDERHATKRIRCPLCEWQPSPESRWSCLGEDTPEAPFSGCGTIWNTFDTRGRCPGCAHQWRWTSCLRCGGWSPHDDWYATEDH